MQCSVFGHELLSLHRKDFDEVARLLLYSSPFTRRLVSSSALSSLTYVKRSHQSRRVPRNRSLFSLAQCTAGVWITSGRCRLTLHHSSTPVLITGQGPESEGWMMYRPRMMYSPRLPYRQGLACRWEQAALAFSTIAPGSYSEPPCQLGHPCELISTLRIAERILLALFQPLFCAYLPASLFLWAYSKEVFCGAVQRLFWAYLPALQCWVGIGETNCSRLYSCPLLMGKSVAYWQSNGYGWNLLPGLEPVPPSTDFSWQGALLWILL